MSTIKNPVGPQPPSVYWRRRLLLVAVLVIIIVVIVLIVTRPSSGGTKTPTGGQTSGQPGTTPSSGFTAAAGDGSAACDPSVITLSAVTDATTYPADAQPQLSMKITNNGASACTLDVGTDAQVYTVTSGTDQIWVSTDCQTSKAALKQVLKPGAANAVSTTPFAWDRTRSSTTTCTGSRPAVTAGGASYHLGVKLGSITTKSDKQFVLQ